MAKRNIGQEILEGLQEIKVFKSGKVQLQTRLLKQPMPPHKVRAQLKLSQSAFAGLMGVSVRTVQEWEQGRRRPSGPAKTLLRIAAQHPEVLTRLG